MPSSSSAGVVDVGREAVPSSPGVGEEEEGLEDTTKYGFDSDDDEDDQDDEAGDDGDGAGVLLTVVAWVGGLLSSLEGLFASFGMYVLARPAALTHVHMLSPSMLFLRDTFVSLGNNCVKLRVKL
jgi:hypothetical protein